MREESNPSEDRFQSITDGGPGATAASVDAVRDLPPMLGIADAARYLGISRTTAYSLAAAGELPVPVLRIGHSYRVPTAPLLEVLGLNTLPANGEPSPCDGQNDQSPESAASPDDPADQVPAEPRQPGYRSCRYLARGPVSRPWPGR
jgi:excisionase family DNA binding protein